MDNKKKMIKLEMELSRAKEEAENYKTLYEAMVRERDVYVSRWLEYQGLYNAVAGSRWWRYTAPLRKVTGVIKRILMGNPVTRSMCRGILTLKRKITGKGGIFSDRWASNSKVLSQSRSIADISGEERAAQQGHTFDRKIKFSILVPLYNTPKRFLKEMIESVIGQTYSDWELCLADGSDSRHGYVENTVRGYIRRDSRIKYRKLEKNTGISGNTNACIDMAEGDYISLFDHDDLLHPSALFMTMKEICEKDADLIYTDEAVFMSPDKYDLRTLIYKPDFAPDTLRGCNYICHFTSFKASLLEETACGKYFRSECDGSQDYDMVLRLTEKAKKIVHIKEILYLWRNHPGSVASTVDTKPYTVKAAHRALEDHLERLGLPGTVHDTKNKTFYRIRYKINGRPKVSVIIPNKDDAVTLSKCLESIYKKSTYKNFEVIIVENNSTCKETFEYYSVVPELYKNCRVINYEGGFNYSKINNFAFKEAKGEYIICLNNDIEIISPDWIQEMLMFVQRSEVGAAGMMLYYPDNTVQHAGVILGIGGVAGHSHKCFPRGEDGYMNRLGFAQNLSAVTAAAIMVKAKVLREINGFDEEFAVAFNDVDLCMRIREAGYLIVWTPFAEAYHYESKTRGYENTPEKIMRFEKEIQRFKSRWGEELEKGDPYYSPHLTLEKEDFSYSMGETQQSLKA